MTAESGQLILFLDVDALRLVNSCAMRISNELIDIPGIVSFCVESSTRL